MSELFAAKHCQYILYVKIRTKYHANICHWKHCQRIIIKKKMIYEILRFPTSTINKQELQKVIFCQNDEYFEIEL